MKLNRAKKELLYFGVGIGILLILASFAESLVYSFNTNISIVAAVAGVIFLTTGIIIGYKYLTIPKIEQQRAVDSNENFAPEISKNNGLEELSSREFEVLALISVGMTNAEISEKLFISLNTTKTHIQKIYSKLGVKNRTQALLKAKKSQIVNSGD